MLDLDGKDSYNKKEKNQQLENYQIFRTRKTRVSEVASERQYSSPTGGRERKNHKKHRIKILE